MLIYCLLAATLLLACIPIYVVTKTRGHLKDSWPRLLFAVSLGFMVCLYGAWYLLSVYLQFVSWSLTVGLAARAAVRPKPEVAGIKKRRGLYIAGSALCILLIVLYHTGTKQAKYSVNLHFPLKHGKYLVMQGGKGLPTNLFHYSYRGASFAMDLVELNKWGNRANTIFSRNLDDYCTYGDTVYAPCSGRVLRMHDDNPDNVPSVRKRGPTNTNQVVIAADSYYVFMAHLQQHKVFVREGDSVAVGQPVGLAGNSGFSLEPHLHIQAHMRSGQGVPWYSEPQALILFDGEEYLLNETVKVE